MDRKISSYIAMFLLVVIFIGATYAYLEMKEASNVNFDTVITTNTVDSLIFSIDSDISLMANPTNFSRDKENRVGTSLVTAELKANNKTNSATQHYYIYLDIFENELGYTTDENYAELLLQVIDPEENEVTELLGLEYKTTVDSRGNSISGFDITTKRELLTIADNYEITTNGTKTDEWIINVVFVNLPTDQMENGGKKFSGKILVQKEKFVYPFLADYVKSLYTGVQGENNIYYHKNLANSAEDESYRYAGSYDSVENYVCFGDLVDGTCPHDNMYRIIGVFGDNVKLIKADCSKYAELGINGAYRDTYAVVSRGNWGISNGGNSQDEVGAYYWNYDNSSSNTNNWKDSKLNKINLNTNYIGLYSSEWTDKISMTNWQVGGNTMENIIKTNAANVYQNEIVSPYLNETYTAKIGLMYVSDYMYGTPPENWTYIGSGTNGYNFVVDSNWIYIGLDEWILTKLTDLGNGNNTSIYIGWQGHVGSSTVSGNSLAIRPSFYLNSDVIKISGTGSYSDPYIIK